MDGWSADTLLRAVAGATADLVQVRDLAGRIVFANESLARMLGRSIEDLIGTTAADLLPPDQAEAVRSNDWLVMESSTTQVFEHTVEDVGGVGHVLVSTKDPLHDVHGTVIGLVSISHDVTERRRIDEALRSVYASQAAARERVERLVELTQGLAGAVTVREVCEATLRASRAGVGAEAGAVVLRQGPSDGVEVVCADRTAPLPAVKVWRTGVPLWLGSREEVAAHDPEIEAESVPLGAAAFVPLMSEGVVRGVIALGFVDPRSFAHEDREVLLTIARQASQALERASLYASEAGAREDAERSAYRTSRLQSFTASLARTLSVDSVLDIMVKEGVRAAGADGAWVALVDPSGAFLETVAAVGFSQELLTTYARNPVDANLAGPDAFRDATPLWFSSIEEFAHRYPDVDISIATFRGALACVPLIAQDASFGIFVLQFSQALELTADDRAFINALATQAAQAMQRARLYESEADARARTARLHLTTARLSQATSTHEAADVALAASTDAVGASVGALVLANDEGDLRFVAASGTGVDDLAKLPCLSGGSRTALSEAFRSCAEVWAAWGGRWEEELPVGFATAGDSNSAVLALPLIAAGACLGAIGLVFAGGEPPSAQDREVLVSLAGQTALTLRRAIVYDLDREVASTLQHAMQPRSLPAPPGVTLTGRYVAATERLEVGGDWFDALVLNDGRVALVVGDVVGRGLAAASAMGQLRTAWRALVSHFPGPAGTLRALDGFASGVDGALCTTVASVEIARDRRSVRYVCAGHPPPMLMRRDGSVRFLDAARAMPLAVGMEEDLAEGIEPLRSGDRLLLYTDGLIERRDESLDEGFARLSEIARGLVEDPAEEMCDAVLERLVGASGLGDDVAILCAEVTPVLALRSPADPAGLVGIRHAVAEWLLEERIPAEALEDIVLVVGEACSNVVEHAYTHGGDAHGCDVEVRLAHAADGSIEVCVRDWGSWTATAGAPLPPVADPFRGNGLRIMRAVMDEVEVVGDRGGTTVTMRRRLLVPAPD